MKYGIQIELYVASLLVKIIFTALLIINFIRLLKNIANLQVIIDFQQNLNLQPE